MAELTRDRLLIVCTILLSLTASFISGQQSTPTTATDEETTTLLVNTSSSNVSNNESTMAPTFSTTSSDPKPSLSIPMVPWGIVIIVGGAVAVVIIITIIICCIKRKKKSKTLKQDTAVFVEADPEPERETQEGNSTQRSSKETEAEDEDSEDYLVPLVGVVPPAARSESSAGLIAARSEPKPPIETPPDEDHDDEEAYMGPDRINSIHLSVHPPDTNTREESIYENTRPSKIYENANYVNMGPGVGILPDDPSEDYCNVVPGQFSMHRLS